MKTYNGVCIKKEDKGKKMKFNWMLIRAKALLKQRIVKAREFLKSQKTDKKKENEEEEVGYVPKQT